ncbi:MAG TPA: AgmX/PglI C-terminal domain-containing protein [Anaeromyxobacter sp.]|nr:AgmX/PglI C-terminal domain-containing protein [Anaeromyxobacter sp.]
MSVRAILAAVVAVALLPGAAAGQTMFPARSGETGILDVPDAETSGRGGGQLAVEYRYDHAPGYPDSYGPWPLYAVMGTTPRLDVGLTFRQGGQPDDPRPSRVLFGTALKLQLRPPAGAIPGIALSAVFDRFNARGVVGGRLALSTTVDAPFRVAGFVGGEAEVSGFANGGLTAGLAASVALHPRLDLSAEALTGPRGLNYGGAIRLRQSPTLGVAIGGNYFPDDDSYSVGVTLAVAPAPAPRRPVPAAAPVEPERRAPIAAGPRFLDDRPHFRLRMAQRGPEQRGQAGRLQYGPYTAPAAVAAATPARPTDAAAKAAAPSLEDLADAQLKDQEALASTRDRRVRATADELGAREKAGGAEAAKLAEQEKGLVAREQQLDAREKVIVVRGPPTQQQRQLESLEAQLASEMQKLSALERSYIPALDAAQGRERDAGAREKAEQDEAQRLAAAATAATSRATQLEIRKQALGATNRALAALENRLVAIGERLDAIERQLRLRAQRLDAWSRKLDARAERLDLLEQAAAPRPPPAQPKTTDAGTPAAPPKDKAAFVMVVKSPTAIMKEKSAAPGGQPAAAPVHAGVAVEKAVAAATIVAFPTPASQLSELDRETLENIAKLAAKDRCELLIWARAKDPNLMTEAQRRATEIKTLVLAAAKLDPAQVVTRITTRPGAQGVDVVVSALRETSRPAAAAAPAPAAPALLSAESGKRQIREAVQAAQASIEACVGDHLRKRRLQRAEGVLKLTVSTQGRVVKIGTAGGDLAGDELETCLGGASSQWQFPTAEGEYVVDVPITVMTGGPAR